MEFLNDLLICVKSFKTLFVNKKSILKVSKLLYLNYGWNKALIGRALA